MQYSHCTGVQRTHEWFDLEERLRHGQPLPTLREALEGPEEQILRLALSIHGGNRKETACMLGVNRTTLFNKMRKYGLLDVDFDALPARESKTSRASS